MRALLTLLAGIVALLAHPAVAQEYPPRPDGPVLDAANLLPPAEQTALEQRLATYNRETGRALIVATVPSLGGESIEMYSARLFERWGIGGADTDQGLLLLVAPNERQVRIEVGNGLTPYVTDILSGRIIRQQVTPAFQNGDYPGGINAGINALITQLNRDPADAAAIAEAAAAAEAQGGEVDGATIGGAFFWVMLILAFMFMFGRGRGRRYSRRRRYGAGSAIGNVIMWSALGSAMVGRGHGGGFGGGSFGGGGGMGGFGGFGGGISGGGGASGSW